MFNTCLNNGLTRANINLVMPDYSAGISKTWNTVIQAEYNGWIHITGQTAVSGTSSYDLEISSDGINFEKISQLYTATAYGKGSVITPIAKGMYYKATEGSYSNALIFYPCIGG